MLVALALAIVDADVDLTSSPPRLPVRQAATALAAGGVGGFLGGLLVGALHRLPVVGFGLGWGVVGLAAGAAPGLHGLLLSARAGRDVSKPARRVTRGLL